jgi:hypothetical protein
VVLVPYGASSRFDPLDGAGNLACIATVPARPRSSIWEMFLRPMLPPQDAGGMVAIEAGSQVFEGRQNLDTLALRHRSTPLLWCSEAPLSLPEGGVSQS